MFTSGALTLRLDLQQLPAAAAPPLPILGVVAQSTVASRYASAVATPLARSPSPAGGLLQPAALHRALDEQQPPRHRMCRSVKTVERLWREWTVGLRGQPSIRQLNSR